MISFFLQNVQSFLVMGVIAIGAILLHAQATVYASKTEK